MKSNETQDNQYQPSDPSAGSDSWEDFYQRALKAAISELPGAQAEACNELAEHIRRAIKQAGEPVGSLALALVGAETAAIRHQTK